MSFDRPGGHTFSSGYFFDVQLLGDPQALSDWAVTNPYAEFIESRKQGGRLRIESVDIAARVLNSMVRDGLQVVEFHKEQRNLEDAFIDMLDKVNTPPAMPQWRINWGNRWNQSGGAGISGSTVCPHGPSGTGLAVTFGLAR